MSTNVIVNLDDLDSTKPLEEENLIFGDAFKYLTDNVVRKVKDNTKFLETHKEYPAARKNNLCFFINGGRGMGKSTLLRALRHHLEKNSNNEIRLLAKIDPTELGEKEHFFVHLLSEIFHLLNPEDRKGLRQEYSDKEKQLRKEAQRCIMDMSKGLQLISDMNGRVYAQEDADFYIEECVEQCASSAQLKDRFNHLLTLMCEICGVSAFLITVDDADMNFRKCKDVLELVRKYMLSPRLVFVFAGDLKLYSLVVRAMQLSHFGELSLQYDSLRENHRNQLLDNLEEQYLMKLFPAENRINLTHVSSFSLQREIHLSSSAFANDEKQSLHHFLRSNLAHLYASNHHSNVVPFIEGQSIRSTLQLVKYWSDHVAHHDNNADNRHIQLARGAMLIASQALIKHKIDFMAIHGGNTDALSSAVMLHTLSLDMGMEGAKLIPNIGEHSQRLTSFYLETEVARQLRSFPAKLIYFCRVFPALHMVMNFALQETNSNLSTDEKNTKRLLLLQQSEETSCRHWGAVCTAYFAPHSNRVGANIKRYGCGAIRILKTPATVACRNARGEVTSNSEAKKEFNLMGLTAYKDELFMLADEKKEENSGSQKKKQTESAAKKPVKRETLVTYVMGIYHSLSCVREPEGFAFYLSVYNLLFLIVAILDACRDTRYDEAEMKAAIKDILLPKEALPGFFRADSSVGVTDDANQENGLKNSDFIDFFKKNKTETEKVVSDIAEWVKGLQSDGYDSFASQFEACWASFMNHCENITEEAVLSSQDNKKIVRAGNLFSQYLSALPKSMDETLLPAHMEPAGKSPLAEQLRQFPLWNALVIPEKTPENIPEETPKGTKKEEAVDNAVLHALTNRLSVGSLTYIVKKKVTQKKPGAAAPIQPAAPGA